MIRDGLSKTGAAGGKDPPRPDRPNIIWVFPDQMRAQAMGCAGDPNVRTPNLDALARRGTRFTAACSNYPVCVPARFTMLTGERASSRWIPTIHWRMSPAERTVAHELGEAGYATSYIGKWHLYGGNPPAEMYRRIPVPRSHQGGFERWQGFEFRNDPFDTYYFVNDDPEPHRIEGYQTEGLFDLALLEIDRLADGDRPFFLALSVEPPHPPYQGPRFFENTRSMSASLVERVELRPNVDVELFGSQKQGFLRRWRRTQEELASDASAASDSTDRQVLQAMLLEYGESIECIDRHMGRLLDRLEERGVWEDTVVIFFADHGELLGSHGTQGKQLPFAESVGIPLIIAGADRSDGPGPVGEGREDDGGRIVTTPVSLEDLFPTTIDLAGVEISSEVQGRELPGRSLLPLIGYGGGLLRPFDRDAVFLEYVEEHRDSHKSIPPWRGIRTERYCYTVTTEGPWMLSDLVRDPYERCNLVDHPEYVEVCAALHERLMNHLLEIEDPFARICTR